MKTPKPSKQKSLTKFFIAVILLYVVAALCYMYKFPYTVGSEDHSFQVFFHTVVPFFDLLFSSVFAFFTYLKSADGLMWSKYLFDDIAYYFFFSLPFVLVLFGALRRKYKFLNPNYWLSLLLVYFIFNLVYLLLSMTIVCQMCFY